MTIIEITTNANRLYEVRQAIDAKKEAQKKELESLEQERDLLQLQLIKDLKENNLASIKVSSGDTFTKAVRQGFEINDELRAIEWAIENRAVSVNRVIMAQKLKDVEEIPKWATKVETEYISVRKAKELKE